MMSDHEARLNACGMCGKTEAKGTIGATPAIDNHWRWARRIEARERIAEAALRKEEAAAINAINALRGNQCPSVDREEQGDR